MSFLFLLLFITTRGSFSLNPFFKVSNKLRPQCQQIQKKISKISCLLSSFPKTVSCIVHVSISLPVCLWFALLNKWKCIVLRGCGWFAFLRQSLTYGKISWSKLKRFQYINEKGRNILSFTGKILWKSNPNEEMYSYLIFDGGFRNPTTFTMGLLETVAYR